MPPRSAILVRSGKKARQEVGLTLSCANDVLTDIRLEAHWLQQRFDNVPISDRDPGGR